MADQTESENERRRIIRNRNRVFALALGAFVTLVYAVSIVKMQ